MKIKFTFLFIFLVAGLVFAACKKKKDDPVPSQTTPALPSIDKPYLGVYVNDRLLSILADTHTVVWDPYNDSLVLSSYSMTNGAFNTQLYSSGIWGEYNNHFQFIITRNAIGTTSYTEEEFKTLFTLGEQSYSQNYGFDISLKMNHSNEYYNTHAGSQEGSSIIIKQAEFVTLDNGDRVLHVVIEFSCKLYDDNGKIKMNLSHGIYRGNFITWSSAWSKFN